MAIAHLTLPTQDVPGTARFFEQTLGWQRVSAPANSPVELIWLQIAPGQQAHIIRVEGFRTSPFEAEFGRHTALYHSAADFEGLKQRVRAAGGEVIDAVRPTPFGRFFFKDPNGYAFEVIEREHYIAE